MMFKMMSLMRVFLGLGKIVELVKGVIGRSAQFLLFFGIWIVV